MPRYRGFLVILMSAALLAATAATATLLLWPRLPHPSAADRDQLLKWLVLRDLGSEPTDTRRALARRLEEEYSEGIDWAAVASRLDASQRRRVWDNVLLLVEPWFADKANRYFVLTTTERSAYLDQFIDTIGVWRGVDSLCAEAASAGGRPDGRDGLLGVLLEKVERLKGRAEPAQRKRIVEFQTAVNMRWLLRSLQPPSSTAP